MMKVACNLILLTCFISLAVGKPQYTTDVRHVRVLPGYEVPQNLNPSYYQQYKYTPVQQYPFQYPYRINSGVPRQVQQIPTQVIYKPKTQVRRTEVEKVLPVAKKETPKRLFVPNMWG